MKYYLASIYIFYSFILSCQNNYWNKLETESYKGKQDDIYFTDENNAWYVNGYGSIYHTSDGGISWTKQLEKKGTFFRCIAFLDNQTGFAGTIGTDYFPNVKDTIPLYKTIDGGKTWEPVNYEGSYVKGLCALDIVKEKINTNAKDSICYHIYAVGRVGAPANLLVSHDNGNSFKSIKMDKYVSMLFDIKMFDKNKGIACGTSNSNLDSCYATIITTKDGGITWKTVYKSKRLSEYTWKCFFVDKKVGYATIQNYSLDSTISQQHIVKSTNGGKTWKELNLCNNYKAKPFGIGFINKKIGFVGTKTNGYQTTNGGKTWYPIELGKFCNKIRIKHMANGKIIGYAIGSNVYKLLLRDSSSCIKLK